MVFAQAENFQPRELPDGRGKRRQMVVNQDLFGPAGASPVDGIQVQHGGGLRIPNGTIQAVEEFVAAVFRRVGCGRRHLLAHGRAGETEHHNDEKPNHQFTFSSRLA